MSLWVLYPYLSHLSHTFPLLSILLLPLNLDRVQRFLPRNFYFGRLLDFIDDWWCTTHLVMVKNLATSASKPYGRGGGARVVILRERFWRFCAQSPKAYPSTRLFPLAHPGFFDLFAFHEATACDAGDFSANVIASPSDSRQTTYWIYSTVFASALYAATETSCFVRPVFCLLSRVIGISFASQDYWSISGNRYHQQITWLHFGRKWNSDKEEDTTENSNRHQSVLPRYQTGADA